MSIENLQTSQSTEDYKLEEAGERNKEEYSANAEINGIKILVNKIGKYYEIAFPGLRRDEKIGVVDTVINISTKAKDAEEVFEFAKKIAEQEDDVIDCYLIVKGFIEDQNY